MTLPIRQFVPMRARITGTCLALSCIGIVYGLPVRAAAQDFSQVQIFTNHVLFAKEERLAQERESERRRIEELDQRAQRQSALLDQQTASIRSLGASLQTIQDEKALIDDAEAFDAAVLAGRPGATRSLLADAVTLDLGNDDSASAPPAPINPDALITGPELAAAAGGVLPRSNQRVHVDGAVATLNSDGYAWASGRGGRVTLARRVGRWRYGFTRTPDGWKIDSIVFSRAPSLDQPGG